VTCSNSGCSDSEFTYAAYDTATTTDDSNGGNDGAVALLGMSAIAILSITLV